MSDLKGRRVSTGSPGSATEVMAFRVIEAAGLDKDKDMTRERLGVSESVNAIKTARSTPSSGSAGCDRGGHRPCQHARAEDQDDRPLRRGRQMNKKYGQLYVNDTIPKTMYKGMDAEQQDRDGVEHPGLEREPERQDGVRHREDDFRHKADLVAVHKESENFTLENQKASAVPDPVPSGSGQVFQRGGRQAQIARQFSGYCTTAPC